MIKVIVIVVFGSWHCRDKITVFLPFKVRILVNPFALSMNNLLNVIFSSQEPNTSGNLRHKKTIWDDNIVKYPSWYLFNKKSPLDRDKSHLCVCMIPNWYFESPVALVWPPLVLFAAKRKKNGNSVQSPLSPISKMAGQLIHDLNARPRLVIVFATKAFCFTIQLS